MSKSSYRKRNQELKVKAWDISIPLPNNPEVNSIYYIKNGDKFDIVSVDSSGNYLTLDQPAPPPSSGGVYGSELNVFTVGNITSNSTDVIQEVVNETTTVLPPGKYSVKVSYSWNLNCTQHDFESYLTINNLSITEDGRGLIHKEEPKDSAGDWNGTNSLQILHFNREYTLDLLTEASRNIVLSFRGSKDNIMASIWDIDIKIFRIS